MTDYQPLNGEPAPARQDFAQVEIERRRARILATILEDAPRLHQSRDLSHWPTELAQILSLMFPSARCMVLLRGDLCEEELGVLKNEFGIALNTIADSHVSLTKRIAKDVALAGVPSFAKDFDFGVHDRASCVPLTDGVNKFGAFAVQVDRQDVQSDAELTEYLRLLAAQALVPLVVTSDLRSRREELELMADEQGQSLFQENVPLNVAKRSFERWLIDARLRDSAGNIAAAARALHMDRGQLSRLVKRHALRMERYKS